MIPIFLSGIFIILAMLSISFITQAYAQITLENSDFEMIDSNLNVTTPITIESFLLEGDGFTTRFLASDDLRKYSFDNASSVYDVHWDLINSTKAQFNITDNIANARGNVSGSELGDVQLDDVSVTWVFNILNIVDIDTSNKIEYFFPSPIVQIFNAIVLSLNSPDINRLGGVFTVICPANSTLTGLLTNGTFVCTNMSVFFP